MKELVVQGKLAPCRKVATDLFLLPQKNPKQNQDKNKTIQYVLVLSYYSHFLELTLLEDTPAK